MLRQVAELVVEQAVAVVADKAVDVLPVGLDNAERGLEVLAREREAMAAVNRGTSRGTFAIDRLATPRRGARTEYLQ